MPDDGAGVVPSSVDRPQNRGRSRRTRFRRFVFVAYGVTAALHVVPVLALTLLFRPLVAFLGGAILLAVTLLRLRAMMNDQKRPRWFTRLFDEPVLAHWCACLLATALLPVFGFVALVAGAAGLHDGAPSHAIAVAAAASYVFSSLVAAWGFTGRRRFIRVAYVDIPIEGLSHDLDGYRIVQVSDLHIGNYDSKSRGLEWARRVNALEPDLVAVTGDLVTTGTLFYEDVAEVIGAMRARDGVFVSMGNHDQSDPDTLTRLIRARGPEVLRNASRVVRRGAAELVVAGIDDRMTGQADLERTLEGRRVGAPTVLLAHYPEFFDAAAARDVDLVLSGHTHGGQIALPFAPRQVSLSRLAKQAAPGLHIRGPSRLYVNPGLGTTGPPVRLGIPPEITVLVLRRS
jgi:predicted MPP superfamily phosphohydrolase